MVSSRPVVLQSGASDQILVEVVSLVLVNVVDGYPGGQNSSVVSLCDKTVLVVPTTVEGLRVFGDFDEDVSVLVNPPIPLTPSL